MSKLLLKEYPLILLPSLAAKIGINQAIILQQLHYWLLTSSHEIEGKKWIYNTYKDWQLQFPFWCEKTIARTIRSLEEQGYLLSANFNSLKQDKTKWYTIDYEKLAELENAAQDNLSSPEGQIDRSDRTNCTMPEDSLSQAIPEITTETNTESIYTLLPPSETIPDLNIQTNALESKKEKEPMKVQGNLSYPVDEVNHVLISYQKTGSVPPFGDCRNELDRSLQLLSIPKGAKKSIVEKILIFAKRMLDNFRSATYHLFRNPLPPQLDSRMRRINIRWQK